MAKKGMLLMVVLVMVLMVAGCGSSNNTEKNSHVKLIIVTNEAMNTDEMAQRIMGALKTQEQDAVVNEIEMSEENKYLVTTSTKLTEDEVVSVLENEDWIKTVEINYELKMY